VEKATGLAAKIKWPNDIVVGGRKLAGILVESRGRDSIDIAIAGIGMNVNWSRSDMPPEIATAATSVSEELGYPFLRVQLLAKVLVETETVYAWALSGSDRPRLIEEASSRSNVLGHEVTIAFADGSIRTGVAERITDDGALELATESGAEEIHVGEVKRLRPER
jgi:BirA family biotin operon repressor/biotin-[acetyl-CoA-carboxylase] ligase